MPKSGSGRGSKSGRKPKAGKKGDKSKKAHHKSRGKSSRPDYSRPVWWRKEDVSKPQDWYEQAYGENIFSPNSSTTDIYGKKKRKTRTVALPRGCSFDHATQYKEGTSSPDSANVESSTEEPVDESGASVDVSSAGESKEGTVLKSLTEEEVQKIAEQRLTDLREETEQMQKIAQGNEERGGYLSQTKDWLDTRLKSYYRDTEECEKAMRKRLDEQKSLNDVAHEKSSIISDALLAERHHKLEAFARSSKRWRELLEKKQKLAQDKLSVYRSWTPWAITSYWMKVQIDKITRSNIAEKRQRLATLSNLRICHDALKAKWNTEHGQRHEILQSAIKKENSEHVTVYVQSRLKRIEPWKAQRADLLREIEKWSEIKQRWYAILKTKLSRRHDLFINLRGLDPPGFRLSQIEVPVADATAHSLVEREQLVRDELRELQRDLQKQYTYYDIESVIGDNKVVEAHSYFHDDEEEENGKDGVQQRARLFASLPSMEESVEFSEILEHAFSFSET